MTYTDEKHLASARASRRWRAKNIDAVIKQRLRWHESNKNYRSPTIARNTEKVRQLKESTPCADCHHEFPYYVMHFDHLDASSKIGAVGNMIRFCPWDILEAEIAKCELVCANCHATRTHNRKVEKEIS